jgi:hypothetical protein
MPESVDRRLERVFRRLDERTLGASNPEITAADLDLGPGGTRNERLFGYYTAAGLTEALRAYGTLARLERRVGPLELSLDLEDPFLPRLLASAKDHPEPVIDLSLSRRTASTLGASGPLRDAPLLYVENLVLQNPGRAFSWERPPLPNQRFPGLSLSSEILQLLVLMARRLSTEGVALTPINWVSAAIYSRFFRFVDPVVQGRFLAIRAVSRVRPPLWYTAWASALECLRDGEGAPVHLPASPMLVPLSDRTRALFGGAARRLTIFRNANATVRVDADCLRQRFPWAQMPPDPVPPEVLSLVGPRPD